MRPANRRLPNSASSRRARPERAIASMLDSLGRSASFSSASEHVREMLKTQTTVVNVARTVCQMHTLTLNPGFAPLDPLFAFFTFASVLTLGALAPLTPIESSGCATARRSTAMTPCSASTASGGAWLTS